MTEEQIRKKLSVYLDKNDFDIPSLGDMVDFAQEIATEATKELQEEKKNCWKQCEYANPKTEIIQSYISEKEKVKELEAQIEKMKCCANCKHSRTEYEHCKTNKHEKWEIKEK